MTTSKPEIPTVQEMKTWDEEKLLRWIQQRRPNIFKGDHLEQFKKLYIDGKAFLLSSLKFFHTICGLPPVVSLKLQNLADEVKEEDKLSKQTAGRKRKGKNIFNLAYGQRANNIAGDETDAPESPISPKRNCREDPSEQRRPPDSEIDKADDNLEERVERAIERRARILQEIKAISQFPDAVPLPNATIQLPDTVPLPGAAVQLPNVAVPLSRAELFYAAVQLSKPAIQIKLPFPFIGDSIPERFDYSGDHDHWGYMGRENLRSCWMRLISCRLRGGEAIYSTEPLATENLIF